jgi:hypothetical protein
MLKSDSLTYTDLARMTQDESVGEGASHDQSTPIE